LYQIVAIIVNTTQTRPLEWNVRRVEWSRCRRQGGPRLGPAEAQYRVGTV